MFIFVVFLVIVSVNPVLAILHGIGNLEGFSGDGFTVVQTFRLATIGLMSCWYFLFIRSRFINYKPIIPLVVLCLYCLVLAGCRERPSFDLRFGAKLLYLILIYVWSVYLAQRRYLTESSLFFIAAVIVFMSVCSQVAGFFSGLNNAAYRTNLAMAGYSGSSFKTSADVLMVLPLLLVTVPLSLKKACIVVIGFISCCLTMRRSALLGFFILYLSDSVIVYMRRGLSFKSKIVYFLPGLLVMLFFSYIMWFTEWGDEFNKRILDANVFSQGTGSGRVEFQQYGLDHIFNRGIVDSLIGDGYGFSSQYLYARYGMEIGFHSDYIEMTVCFGIPGLAFFLWFLLYTPMRIVVDLNGIIVRNRILVSYFLMVALLAGITGHTLEPSSAPLFVLLGFLTVEK